MKLSRLRFKIADEAWEFEEISRLNYRTFVEEIPQHREDPSRRLVDRFDDENLYILCERERTLLGMLAVRDRRPFSLDLKLPNLDAYLPGGARICEIRLLSIERERRHGLILYGLLRELLRHCVSRGYQAAVISAAVGRLSFYENLGFVPFGPPVGTAAARFQPMILTEAVARERLRRHFP